MKILIVHNTYKQYGGEDTVVEQEYKAYKELGFEVELYLEKNAELNFSDIFFSIFNPMSAFRFKKKIKEFKPDVVHVHNIIFKLSPSIFWCIPKEVKTFMTIHNYRTLCPSGTLFFDEAINTDSKTLKGLLRNILKGVYQDSILKTLISALIYRFNFYIGSFKKIDNYIFLTPFAQNLHSSWKPKRFKKSIVKPNFLMQSFKDTSSEKTIDLIFVGRFTVEKGILNVLPALLQNKSLKIHLVGDGPEFRNVEQQISECNHIVLHGSKTRKEVFDLLDQSKYLIFPSIWFEGMPVTIIEAYAKSIPVIAREIGAMKSMIINKVSGFHYNTINELQEILENLPTYNSAKMAKAANNEYMTNYSKEQGLNNLSKLIYEDCS